MYQIVYLRFTVRIGALMTLAACGLAASASADEFQPIHPTMANRTIVLTGNDLTIDQVIQVARYGAKVTLSPEARQRNVDTFNLMNEGAAEGVAIYLFNRDSGAGREVVRFTGDPLSPQNRSALESQAFDQFSHGSSESDEHGPEFSNEDVIRAMMVIRANQMTYLAASSGFLQGLIDLINSGITPVMRSRAGTGEAQGPSAGAMDAALVGAGAVYYHGIRMPASEALQRAGLRPIRPAPGDSTLGSVNSDVAGLAAILVHDAARYLDWVDLSYAIDLNGMNSSITPLFKPVQVSRPYRWINWDAARVLDMLRGSYLFDEDKSRIIQDPESMRAGYVRQGSAWEEWGNLRDAVTIQMNGTEHNPVTRVNVSPTDSWELSTPQAMKYYVKGSAANNYKHGFVFSNANWDPYPLSNRLESFTIALANMDVAVMLRQERFSSTFFTVVRAEDILKQDNIPRHTDWSEGGWSNHEVWQTIQGLINPVPPEGYSADPEGVEELDAESLFKVKRAIQAVEESWMLVAGDFNTGTHWLEVRKAQDGSRNFGSAPTAAWQAYRKIGDTPQAALAFVKSTAAETFYSGGPSVPTIPTSAAPEATAPAARISALADEFYSARAHFDPLNYATANGDSRFDDQIGMSISPKIRREYFAHINRLRTQLASIPLTTLSAADKLNESILAFELEDSLDLEAFPEHLLPINQMDNVPSTLANYASGRGSQPLTTPMQYRAYLRRLEQLPGWIEQAVANMREGMRTGIVLPRSITTAMTPQFEQLSSGSPDASIFYTPIKNLPPPFSTSDKQGLTAAYRDVIANRLLPALSRLTRFLKGDYLSASRDTSGLGALPNGAAWYRARIKNNTNLALTPDAIHELGLKEVARIQQEMAQLGPALGYDGPPNKLARWVFEQKKLKPFTTDTQVVEAYRQLYAEVERQLPTYFHILPNARLSIELEPELTRATASDHYTPLAADGSHPGVFWPVVNDPKDYSSVGMVTLFLHEGVPGHHLHAALLKEMQLPDFRKFNTENSDTAAYTEGWALYCETLGREFGFYERPDAYFGHLNDELLRAVRLVVDTGIHAVGWSREKAIAYAVDVLGYSESRAQNQIERYMVMPAQALAYKIGALKILELRERARQALGQKFSYAGFHDVVIGDGTLPLPILETQVDGWIDKEK